MLNLNTYKALKELFLHYNKKKEEIGYSSYFEKKLCTNFVKFIGSPGYCDAVNSGSSAIYIAAAVLKKSEKDEAIICPTTNIGTLSALILNNFSKIHLCDSEKNSYQISLESLELKINKNTKVIIITHVGGYCCDLTKLKKIKNKYPWVKIIEDCSQSHGTEINSKKVGNFGDIACFSTMFRKNLVTGGIGGLIYTKNKKLYNQILSVADRGKELYKKNFNPKNYNFYKIPSLNFNLDEISCFIGNYNLLNNLDSLNNSRFKIYLEIKKFFEEKQISLFSLPDSSHLNFISIYFIPITINLNNIKKINLIKKFLSSQKDFDFNFKYHECIYEWKNFYKYISFNTSDFKNIKAYQGKTINFLFNEKTSLKKIKKLKLVLLNLEKKFID